MRRLQITLELLHELALLPAHHFPHLVHDPVYYQVFLLQLTQQLSALRQHLLLQTDLIQQVIAFHHRTAVFPALLRNRMHER